MLGGRGNDATISADWSFHLLNLIDLLYKYLKYIVVCFHHIMQKIWRRSIKNWQRYSLICLGGKRNNATISVDCSIRKAPNKDMWVYLESYEYFAILGDFWWVFVWCVFLFINSPPAFRGYFAFFSIRKKAMNIILADLESVRQGLHFWFFSIFGPYPKIVLGISILIQEKPAAEWVFPIFRFF